MDRKLLNLLMPSRTALTAIVLVAFLCSLVLGAEFDLVSASDSMPTDQPQRLELDELFALSAIFSFLLAAVALLYGKSAVTERGHRRVLEQSAFFDPLTGLSNRRLFNSRFETALANARDQQLPCAVLLIDLDEFKQVNDQFGHSAGDRLLVEISDRLRSFVLAPEDAARLGGDEFAMILRKHSATRSGASDLIARLEQAIGKPVDIDGHMVRPAASIGAAFSNSRIARSSELLELADRDMYRMKESHRSQTV